MRLRTVLFGKGVTNDRTVGQFVSEFRSGSELADRTTESLLAGIDASVYRMAEDDHQADLAKLRQRARHQVERARLLRDIERELSTELNHVRHELHVLNRHAV